MVSHILSFGSLGTRAKRHGMPSGTARGRALRAGFRSAPNYAACVELEQYAESFNLAGTYLKTDLHMSTALDFTRARFNMVEQQVRTWNVLDFRVLDVLHALPREAFVAPEQRNHAYADLALSLGHGQRMFKPVLEGRMLQALKITGDDEVLEVGTGSGYTAACMARLGRMVTTLERIPALAEQAQARLRAQQLYNVSVYNEDGLDGYTSKLRFDVIALGGAVITIPEQLKQLLSPGGRLFAICGRSPAMEAILLTRVGDTEFREESLFETDVDYLVGAAPTPKFVI